MGSNLAFNSVVSARTRAAEEILDTPDLLEAFLVAGGLKRDLEAVRDRGLQAEALNQAQSSAQAVGEGATLEVLTAYVAMQKEYQAIMAVVAAVKGDIDEDGDGNSLSVTLAKILKNEAPVTIKTSEKDGKIVRKASRYVSQEALRAEIEKDAKALGALTGAHARLKERKVKAERLAKLAKDASKLKGKLSDRAVKKGTAKGSTASEAKAVAAQRKKWGSVYRVLAAVGRMHSGFKQLLSEAGR